MRQARERVPPAAPSNGGMESMKTSVALCTYNGAKHIVAQLRSIAAGTVAPDEIVICDDRSTDDTLALIEAFAETTPIDVRIHRNPGQLGSTRNFERAIGLARYDIVFMCDQDDVWRADRVERSLREFADPAVGGVFSDAELVDEALNPLGERMFEHIGVRDYIERHHADLFDRLLIKPFVTGATMAFRRELADRVSPFPTSRFFIHDGWLALTIAGMAKLHVIDEPLIAYRQHAGQQVGTILSGTAVVAKATIRYPENRREYVDFYRELTPLLAALPLRPEAAAMLASAKAHTDRRMAMGGKSVTRPIAIMQELLRGRYHRYSTGIQSAVKDLLYPQ